MLKKTKDINKSQLFFLMITLGTVFKIIYLPVLLVEVAGHDSWIIILLMWAVELAIIMIVFCIMKLHPDSTIAEIIEKTAGKTVKTIIFILFWAFMMFRSYFIFSTALKFTITNLYDSLPWNPFVYPFLLFMAYGVYKGLRSISRANELFGIIVLVVIVTSVIIFLINADYPTILPIMEFGFKRPAMGFSQYILATGDYLICFLFLGRIKNECGTTRAFTLGAIFAILLTLLFSVAYYTFFNNISGFQHHGHMLSDMAKSFRDSDTLARLDTIVIVFWIIVCLFHLLLHTWATNQCIQDAFKITDKPLTRLLCVSPLILSIAIFSMAFFIATPVTPEIFSGWYRWLGAIPVTFIMPLLFLIFAIILKLKEVNNVSNKQREQAAADEKTV